jgi:hypothetical protein
MAQIVIENLLCGYTIIVADEAERVTSPYGTISIPMRITHSPIPFIVRLTKGGSAFRATLSPVNVKSGDARTMAIEKAMFQWIMENIETIQARYLQNVEKVCEGNCGSKICFSKPSPA